IKSLEKPDSVSPQFALVLRKHLGGASVIGLQKPQEERIIEIELSNYDPSGETRRFFLLVELTGRSANLSLLDGNRRLIEKLRYKKDESLVSSLGMQINPIESTISIEHFSNAELESLDGVPGFGPLLNEELRYRVQHEPVAKVIREIFSEVWHQAAQPIVYSDFNKSQTLSSIILKSREGQYAQRFSDISKAAQFYYERKAEAAELSSQVNAVKAKLNARLNKLKNLESNLQSDLKNLGNEDELKKYGELLLANLANIQRVGDVAKVVDLYDPEQKTIDIPLESNLTPQAGAEHYFKLYQKSRRGRQEIEKRLAVIDREKQRLSSLLAMATDASSEEDLSRVSDAITGKPKSSKSAPKRKESSEKVSGVRTFLSSDHYEIWVGRASKDNDNLTFKLARSSDTWMHVADYPGSHVIVRNPDRKPIPHRTIVEAAQIAAYFSQAKKEGKVDVRYTERKFVHKPKGAAPGLVRIASFKSITVSPKLPSAETF